MPQDMLIVHESPPVDLPRDTVAAMRNGARCACPACGQGALYRAYLKPVHECPFCAEPLYHQRADDAPAYFTMLIVGHVVVGAALSVEKALAPPLWVHALLWGPAALALALVLLPRVKGALIGVQWALRMHGFARNAAPDLDPTYHEAKG